MTLSPQEQEAMEWSEQFNGVSAHRAHTLSALVRRLLEREKVMTEAAEKVSFSLRKAMSLDWDQRRNLAGLLEAALSALNPGEIRP